MGAVSLVISTGAGSEMRHAKGVAVFSGMVGATAFGFFSRRCLTCCCARWPATGR